MVFSSLKPEFEFPNEQLIRLSHILQKNLQLEARSLRDYISSLSPQFMTPARITGTISGLHPVGNQHWPEPLQPPWEFLRDHVLDIDSRASFQNAFYRLRNEDMLRLKPVTLPGLRILGRHERMSQSKGSSTSIPQGEKVKSLIWRWHNPVRLFFSDNSQLGLAPEVSQKGDLICQFLRYDIVILLRRVWKVFFYLGRSFIFRDAASGTSTRLEKVVSGITTFPD
jgi:hypothetical protein